LHYKQFIGGIGVDSGFVAPGFTVFGILVFELPCGDFASADKPSVFCVATGVFAMF
jgi:hypothetical protein